MKKTPDWSRAYVLHDPAFRISFDENDALTVEAALACYQAYCRTRSEQELGTRLHAIESDIERIREQLKLDHTCMTFAMHEMATLDNAVAHYQTHRKTAEASDVNAPVWAQDAHIEQVWQKLHRPPPDSPGPATA
jgi:hypothetical protein